MIFELNRYDIPDVNEEHETESTVTEKTIRKNGKRKSRRICKTVTIHGLLKTREEERNMARKDQKELTGKQKAAILLISLGPDVSASMYISI